MSEEDEDSIAGAFFLPEDGDLDPRAIAGNLVATCEDFSHLRQGEAVIMFLMRRDEKLQQGKAILGFMAVPQFQGKLASLCSWLLVKMTGGVMPDFIMVLDAGFWEQATPQQREALVFHELKHAAQAVGKDGEPRFTDEGDPIWAIAPHDIEEFNDVARRYGAWLPDVTGFAAALRDGGAV
jgi:hypothetical protein